MNKSIILPLVGIGEAARYDESKLQIVDLFDKKEQERFDREDLWNTYRQEDYLIKALPEIAPPIYFSTQIGEPIVQVFGRRYKIKFAWNNNDVPFEAKGKSLVLEPTMLKLTKSDSRAPDFGCRNTFYWKFFGQPIWLQGDYFPADLNGKSCYHFCTIETGWGDCGNWNILVGLDDNNIPNVAYFEASCC